ncbi:MAG: imidazolonepropionase [Anaerolineae bacterium]|nr:imidazolonepropionase [Anaerolineae bacterium]
MPTSVSLIVDEIGQLCTIPTQDGGPQRGSQLGELGIITNAAVAISEGKIVNAGTREEILDNYHADRVISARGRLVTPGLIDPHTHAVWMGDRADEFEQRLQGVSYQEIMAAGGGINRTVQLTRAASVADLVEAAKLRLTRAMQHGTTTMEIKTGYGLNVETEMALLNAIALLDVEHPLDIVPTFLGAHAIPPEFADDPDGYVALVTDQMIPLVASWKEEHWPDAVYCDVFCEEGAFSLEQTRRIFEVARRAGLSLRLHADEFASLGGVELAIEMGARSVDHLLATTPEDAERLGMSDTIAVLMPATPFGLGIANTAPLPLLLQTNAIVALGSDCNPGTAWCENMQFTLALACRQLRMTPAQALCAATINAAFAVDQGFVAGSIEADRRADLVIWDVPDYRHLPYRFGTNMAGVVIKSGAIVYDSIPGV